MSEPSLASSSVVFETLLCSCVSFVLVPWVCSATHSGLHLQFQGLCHAARSVLVECRRHVKAKSQEDEAIYMGIFVHGP